MTRVTVLLIASIMLAACESVSPNAAQVPLPTLPASGQLALTLTPAHPADAPTVEGNEALPVQGVTFSDQGLGISFSHPSDWAILSRAADDPSGVTLHGPSLGQGPEPIIFAITVDVEPVTEGSVKDIVDQQLGQVPSDLSGGIRRMALKVGGEPAEQVIGLPAREGALETFVIHGGQLYLIILQPYDESNESLLPYLDQVRSVYGAVLSSFVFLK